MSWINGDRKLPEFPTRTEKVSVPLWLVLVGIVFRLAGRGLLAAYRHRVAVAVLVGLAVFYRHFGGLGLVALLAGLVVSCLVWRRVHRRSFSAFAGWVRRHVRLAVYRWRWRTTMIHTGFAIRVPVSNGERVSFADYVPRIRKIKTVGVVESLRVGLLPGQTPQQWAGQAEALRHAFRARSCRVRPDGRPGLHTAATLLFRAGVDLNEIRALLRHTRLATTADIYIDVLDDVRRSTARSMDDVLGRLHRSMTAVENHGNDQATEG
jgi:S-DNA-T family DNA segregation ATPase FtsK/SpoIIIE